MTTLLQLRTKAKRRAEMENSSLVADAEWDDYINYGGARLHRLLVSKFGDDYYVSSNDITTVSGTASYSLPSDFQKVRGVSWLDSNGQGYALRKYEFEERHLLQFSQVSPDVSYPNIFYRVVDGNIEFIPTPSGSETIRLYYIPEYTTLSGDSSEVDAKIPNGYEEYIVLWAAIQARDKEQSDTMPLERMLAKIEADINEDAGNRDAGSPPRIINTNVSYSIFDDLDFY